MCLVLGLPLGLLLALGVKSAASGLRWGSLAVVEVGRGAPALILLQFAYFGLPSAGITLSSFTAASLALAWTTGAYTSEIIRAGIEAVPHGQREAALAAGLNQTDMLRYVILTAGPARGLSGSARLLDPDAAGHVSLLHDRAARGRQSGLHGRLEHLPLTCRFSCLPR